MHRINVADKLLPDTRCIGVRVSSYTILCDLPNPGNKINHSYNNEHIAWRNQCKIKGIS